MNSLRSMLAVGTTLLMTVVIGGCDQMPGMDQMSGMASLDSPENVRKMVEDLNAKCPTTVDPITSLESITMPNDKVIRYRYKVSFTKKGNLRISPSLLRKQGLEKIRQDDFSKQLAEEGYMMEHTYFNQAGGQITSFIADASTLNANADPEPSEENTETAMGEYRQPSIQTNPFVN